MNNYGIWWFQTFYIFHNIWDVILPIDSYFSRWLLHHQPVMVFGVCLEMGGISDPEMTRTMWWKLDSDKSMYAHVAVDLHGAVFKYHIIAKYMSIS